MPTLGGEVPTPVARRVTRADVARLAGVSTAVVSYVLNDAPKSVAEATRRRVLEAVDVLGYRPNAAARALSSGTSGLLALVVPDQRNPFFAELVVEVDRATRGRGKRLLISSSHFRETPDADEIAGFLGQQVEGMIAADDLTSAELLAVERSRTPLVLINQFLPHGHHPSLGSDYLSGARDAVEHLVTLGHRHIAFIGHDSPVDPRERGWHDALAAAGLPRGPVQHVEFSLQGGYSAGARIAVEFPEVTAVFAASDQLATGAVAALHTAGLRVPDDVSMIGFDGTPEGEFLWPPLTTVSQPISRMAADAVEALIVGTASGHRSYATELLVRGSTAPPPVRSGNEPTR